MRKIMVGSDFSGIGAFDQALTRLGIDYETVFSCDMDKYARKSYVANYGEPQYYPENVYDRIIPIEPLDIYMTSPPCQAFSLAGKRKGEEDKRGVLFYNSHEFIKINSPRYFIFENVKGLLSDDNGKTFQRWCDFLGGKSVNGNPVIFPHEESVPYHIYYAVLNAKNYGIPQNRERVFVIGIRDDSDNIFTFPKPFELKKRLKDVLESNVDEKYFLSEIMADGFIGKNINEGSNAIRCGGRGSKTEKHNWDLINVGYINQDTQASKVFSQESVSQTLCAGTHGYANGYVEVVQLNPSKESGGKQPYQHNRIYADYGVMTTLDTECGRPSVYTNFRLRKLTPRECLRLMDFPDSLKMVVSDSQLYKQAGNSICVGVLVAIINNLRL